jgi:TolA-binding protein
MEKEIVKQGVKLAEEQLRDKQVEEVKKIVLRTLEKIDKIDKEISDAKEKVKDLEETKKILKMDIDDMKEGRIDRIAERQEKDEKAKNTSVVIIIKEKETVIEKERPIPYWYYPYQVIWKTEYNTYPIGGGLIGGNIGNNFIGYSSSIDSGALSINCSVAKFATIGTYNVDGSVINLR